MIFLLYGTGTLLPWNVILSCLDFLIYEVSTKSIKLNLDARIQPCNGLSICSEWSVIDFIDLGDRLWKIIFIHTKNRINFYA